MNVRKVILAAAVGTCCISSVLPATLRQVDVSKEHERYLVFADTHLDATPEAIYKESGYLPPDSDGTPLVYTRVEGCLLLFCRSMRRVERLEVVTAEYIRSRVLPERSDFKYAMSEWSIEPESGGTKVTYRMEMEPDFWLPPFVGPWFLKRTLLHGAPEAIEQIERLAQQLTVDQAVRVDPP